MRGIFEAFGLLAVNYLGEESVKKGVFNVELMDRPPGGDGEGENDADGTGFNYGGKGFVVVDAMFLGKTSDDPTRFVARERAIGVELMLINPLTRDDISAGRSGNKLPCGVLDKGVEFRAHGLAPVRIVEG
jgi:hypothetical protein